MKFILLFILIIFIYMFLIEPNILVVKKLKIQNEKLKGLRIVFASDFHVKPYDKFRLRRIVRKINAQTPDIILLGGDYVNGHKRGNTLSIDKISKELGNLKSKYGTLAVMGNHDGWQGKRDVIKAFENVGITVLENSRKDFDRFSVAGVEDLQTGNPNIEQAVSDVTLPLILISHTPDVIEKIPAKVDLTLSGHTHGGQIVLGKPLVVPSKFGTKYAYGWFPNEKLYVSRGLGSSILPLRFNCFPEITVIEFE